MQRKKKVETYDAEDIDYLAPAAAQAPQPSYGAGHMQNGAGCLHAASPSQHAPAPVAVQQQFHQIPATTNAPSQVKNQPVQPVQVLPTYQHVTSPPAPSTSYKNFEAGPPITNSTAADNTEYREYDYINEHSQPQLSPIAVPSSLRPISKGIKRSPSAGIISALAAAESMARAGSSTNASASPAPSSNGDSRIPSGGLPSVTSGGFGGQNVAGSNNALPSYPNVSASSLVIPDAEPEYIATSFAVCSAPIFASEEQSDFDAIADSADALDSFNLDDSIAPEAFSSAGGAWLPPAQAWQQPPPAPTDTAQPQMHTGSAPPTTEAEPDHVEIIPHASQDAYQYTNPPPTAAASPSPNPHVAPLFKKEDVDVDEDFFAQIGDDATAFEQRNYIDNGIHTDVPAAAVDDAPFMGMTEQQQDVVENQKIEEEQQPLGVPTQEEDNGVATEHKPGSTWVDDAGYCYYLSEDGWKYFWDNTSQQWQAHEYIGTGGGGGTIGGSDSVDAAARNGLNGGIIKDEQIEGVVVEEQQQDVPEDSFTTSTDAAEVVPAPEASFSDYAVATTAAPVVFNQEDSRIEVVAEVSDWNITNGQQQQEFQTSTQYGNYYEQQQQQQHTGPSPSAPPQQHNTFLPQQQHQQPPAVSVSPHHTTPSGAPSPATFLPNKSNQQTGHEFTASMHPSPYLQPTQTTTIAPTWSTAAASIPIGSPPGQLQSRQQHNHYQSPHQQYHHHQNQDRSLHPACGFAKLTFGGRLVRVSPSGTITTHLFSALPHDVLHPVGAGPTVSITSRNEMLNAFPGPLGTNLNKEKASAFFEARKEGCVREEPGGDAAALHTLWSVLEAQALHPPTPGTAVNGGHASHTHPNGAASSNGVDAALAAALRQHPGTGAASASTASMLAPSAPPSPAALQSIQDLILSGRKTEALKSAVQCHAWPLALILARSLGAAEWQSAVESFAVASFSPASPLNTVCMLASGASTRAIPDPTTNPAAAGQVLETWRQHAAALALGHMQGAEQALEALGDALLSRGCVSQAHTCFVLAGVPLQPSDSTNTNTHGQQHRHFVLVGSSRIYAPRTYAALPSILRTEMFTWSRTVGNTQAVPNFLWVLPYKLIHAYALAEMGLLSQSSQYCSSILTTLQGLGTKVPPGLAVCRASATDLNDRLQHLAAARKVSLAGAFNAGTIVSSVGKLLDRGISALMGGERQHSRTNSFTTTDIGIPTGGVTTTAAAHSRRSSVTTVPSSPLKMPAGAMGATGGAPTPPPQGDDSHLHPPKLLSNFMNRVASFKSIVTPEPTTAATAPADPSEPENTFYYDNELKIWRERGKAPPPPPEEPPPPPTMASWQTPPPATLGAPPGSSLQHGAVGGGGVSRYAVAPIGAGVAVASSPAQATSLLPPTTTTGTLFKPYNSAASAGTGGAGFGGAGTFSTPPVTGGPAASQYPAQFVPQQNASYSNSAAGYYGQSSVEEMSEVEL